MFSKILLQVTSETFIINSVETKFKTSKEEKRKRTALHLRVKVDIHCNSEKYNNVKKLFKLRKMAKRKNDGLKMIAAFLRKISKFLVAKILSQTSDMKRRNKINEKSFLVL